MLPDLGLVNLVFISGLVCAATSEPVVCPDSSQWSLRTRAFCNSTHPSLNCLYEETTSTFVQFCTTRPDFQRPGYKFIIRGNIDGIECDKNRFQPIKFWTNGSSDCILEKTRCNEPGQVIHVEGDSTSDRTCRCDYTKGFAFVSQRQDCFCDPFLEDCSCFLKPCGKFQVMTPDYNCIDAKDWKGIFKCPVITKTMTTSATRCPTTPPDLNWSPIMAMVAKRFNVLTIKALIVTTVTLVVLFTACTARERNIENCCRNLNMTDKTLDEKYERMMQEIVKGQTNFKEQFKQRITNYKEIITGINTEEIVDKLTLITGIDKRSIELCQGRRQKNNALLEIVWNNNFSLYDEFINAILNSDSARYLACMIWELTDFKEENFYNGRDFLKQLEENSYNPKIPEDVRNVYETYFKTWYKDDEKFTVTTATCKIESILEQKNCVLVVGRSGNGKSAMIRHIALKLFNENGYDVIPIVLDLSTILQYYDPNRKQLFVLDDFCGKVETNDLTVQMWSLKIYDVLTLIKNNSTNTQGSVKLLLATQPFVFENCSFNVECFSEYKLHLSEHPLNDTEKIEMIKKYLPIDHKDILPELSSHNKDIVPLLCKFSEGKTAKQIIELFNEPDEVIKKDFFALQKTNKKQICLLSLCVLFKGLTKDMFSSEKTPANNETIEVVCSEFDLDFSDKNTKSKLQAELTYLEKTYFVNSGDTYYFVHKDIYNIAAVSCGVILKKNFIRFAYSSFIAERYSFVSKKTKKGENIINIDDKETQNRYFDRLWNDLEQGITYSTFHNRQLEDEAYRIDFCKYCLDRKPNMVKILNQLQKRASEPQSNRHDTPIAPRKENINEYKDYIDFKESWQFSSHNMKIPLIESAWEGHKEIVDLLIELERNVNETDNFGRSALYIACYRGKIDVVKLLLKAGADLSLCEANEKSLLYAASKQGHTQIVRMLLIKGASTSKCDKNGYSPLHAASAEGHKDILSLLLAKTNVDKCDNLGRSALFVASDNDKKRIVKLLLKENANINNCDLKGFSPLMAACSRGFLGVVEKLISAKPDVINIDDQDVEKRSALFFACKKGHDKIVDFLLKHNADVLQLDCHQQSPLFIASSFGHEKVVTLLIENVETIYQSDEEGKTPLFIACEKGQEKIVDILLPKCLTKDVLKTDNKVRSPMYVACRGGFLGIVKKLAGKGAKTDVSNIWKETPLFAASRGGHVMVVRYLIDNNMNKTNLDFAESNGHTPLWIACDEGNLEIVKRLVEKGAAINHQDRDKRTPLFVASKGNYVDIVRFLIDNKADLNSVESNGQTPLSIACDERHVEIVNILVDKGADVNLLDNDNRTPLDVAIIRGNTDIEKILKQKLSTETKTANTNVKE